MAAVQTARDPVEKALRRKSVLTPRRLRILSVLLVAIAWEAVGRRDPLFTSYPTAVAQAAWDVLIVNTELPRAFLTTLHGLLTGYVIAVAIGVPLGFAMARVRSLGIALDPYVTALFATPRITLIPLLVLWVGIDYKLRVAIVVLSAVFPIIINIRDGAREVDSDLLDVARSLGGTRLQIMKSVVIPATLPYLFVALRIGAQRAIIGVIVAEMTSALAGTGRVLLDYSQFFRTDRIMVAVLIIGFFSIVVTWGLRKLQERVSPWETAARDPLESRKGAA
jgi:NitT/TauT family transport system permease protein